MPYHRNNYSYTVDSSFNPFQTMQEMLVPFTAYKEAYEKAEEDYRSLQSEADKFKLLSEDLPEGSRAKAIYQNYANDLKAQADDLMNNGLNINNKRALTGLKRRYQGEIGQLAEAKIALDKEEELRRQLSLKDPSMLFKVDNLNIDDYLGGNKPDVFGLSGNDLYTKGAAAGKAASMRIYSDPKVQQLDKYYNNYFNTVGYSEEKMQEFRNNLAAIPELQRAAMDIAKANRVDNLGEGSNSYNAAMQQIINGIADGAIFQRKDQMQRNLGQLTAAEEESKRQADRNYDLNKAQFDFNVAKSDYVYDPATKTFKDKNEFIYEHDEKTGERTGIKPEYRGTKTGTTTNPTNTPGTNIPGVTSGNGETPSPPTQEVPVKELITAKNTALKNLTKTELGNDNGFDVVYYGQKEHFNYVKLFYNKGDGTYQAGSIGDDVEGPGWGFTSSSNVMNRKGRFSMSRIDNLIGKDNATKNKTVHVLSNEEWLNLYAKDPAAWQSITDEFRKLGGGLNEEFQVVEVPNEDSKNRKGYALAVSDDVMDRIKKRKETKK